MEIALGPRGEELNQLKNSYLARELVGANEEVKHPHRVKVAKFFAEFQNQKRTRCFCLPGVRWAFENELANHTGSQTEFVGVERVFTILEEGIKKMPGFYLMHDVIDTRNKRFRGYATNRASILWCSASTFMEQGRSDKVNRKQRRWWSDTYKRWTCAWLDFSCPISAETIACCKRLEQHLDDELEEVPIAVTFMMGREDSEVYKWIRYFSPGSDKLEDRATFLRVLWESNRYRTMVMEDFWQYTSAGGAPIGVAIFRCKLKRSLSSP